MKWTVATTHLRGVDGELLGIARANGIWEAQEYRDGVEFTTSGRADPQTLKAAQVAAEKFLRANRHARAAAKARKRA